jgi:hypothetical protein
MQPPEGITYRILANERKTPAEEMAYTTFHVLLNDRYPAIQPQDRAVVDGVTFDILGVETDSQRIMTRLKLQLATI